MYYDSVTVGIRSTYMVGNCSKGSTQKQCLWRCDHLEGSFYEPAVVRIQFFQLIFMLALGIALFGRGGSMSISPRN